MDLSEKDSGSSSEDNDKLVKVFNNARVPEDSEDEDAIGESSQEEANVEPEVEAKSEAEVDAESEVDEGSEAETAVVTDKEVEQVEPKITKSSGYKRHAYRDIILECFNHYANETISLAKIKSYAHSVHEVRGDYQENVLKAALRRLLKEEVVKNLKGNSKKF